MTLLGQGRVRALVLSGGFCFAAAWLGCGTALAQDFNVRFYGFAQLDYIQDFNRVDPNWDDTLRPSKIPTHSQFGEDGNAVLGVRQSRLGFDATQPAGPHDLYVKLEFDFFGTGDNEGKVTPRLRHAYGTWGPLLIGQTSTLFMDIDTFPNVVDYWGPAGMVFVRNPQLRWTFISDDHNSLAVALENPTDDIDPGRVREIDPALGASITAHETVPDLTAQYRYTDTWGHVQGALLLRDLGFETPGAPNNAPHDHLFGWGIDLTSSIKFGERDKLLLGLVYGHGIASYMNDGGVDLAPKGQPGALDAEAPALTGINIYYDHYWNDQFSTSFGYSSTDLDNTNFQAPDAFHLGQYASANILYTPTDKILLGAEALWGRREDNDGSSGDDFRIQFSAKYSFDSRS